VLDVVDDELNSFVTALAARTDRATFIFDSCHSGSVDRGPLETPDREQVPAPRAIVPAESPPAAPRHIRPEGAAAAGPRSLSGIVRQGRHVLIAGCRDDQTSKETDFEGRRHGALTHFLAGALSSGEGLSVQAAFDRAVAGVKGAVQAQDPVLEGPPERLAGVPF
jgi:hypothetical protein